MAEMYGNISVDSGVKRIGVNEAGEYIELSLTDVTLFERFANLIDWFEKKQEALRLFDADLKARYSDTEDKDGAVIEVIHKRTEVFTECTQKIDDVFGAGCCRKVFGNIIPDELPILDFFDKIMPIMERMAAERGEKLKVKYSRNPKKKSRQRTKEELISDFKAQAGDKDGGTEE